MDLTAKVAALEEEVSILKGEIKMILQELRAAVLARENPFAATNGHDFSGGMSSRMEPATPFDAVFAEPTPPAPVAASLPHAPVAAAPTIVMLREAAPIEPEYDDDAPAPRSKNGQKQAAYPQDIEQVVAEFTPRPRRWSVHSLAALMAWTQEQSQRFSSQDLDIVLSLARYGGLVDEDLEATLEKLAKGLAPEDNPLRASSTDFLLALRQLDALLDEATESADQPARRVS